MVRAVSSMSTNGLRDWFFQRVSAIVMGLYAIFLFGFIGFHPHLDYAAWRGLFAHPAMRTATLLVMLAAVLHVWISIWIVFTDYVKLVSLRVTLQVLVVLLMFSYLIWGIEILFSL